MRRIAGLLTLLMIYCTGLNAHASPPSYLYFVSDSHSYVWFRVPKTASTTTFQLLQDLTSWVKRPQGAVYPYDARSWMGYYKFAFVRNPWEYVVSCYCDKLVESKGNGPLQRLRGLSFEEFVDYIDAQDLRTANIHIRPQSSFFPVEEMDFIGRFENYEADMRTVLRRIGIPDHNICFPHHRKTDHRHYSTYYNERTREIIRRKYQRDIELFGYEFSEEIP